MLADTAIKKAMSRACAEARKWLGATSPNPAVGAVALDESGEVIAVAAHRKAGEGHAEGALLEICRAQNLLPRVDTICVTLEPCNHQGRTPPCTEAIIAAGIRHVVIGTRDPNPHVKGGGAAYLRQRGVEVIEGINENECRQLLAPFSYFVQAGRPFVTVKRAFDGKGSMIPPPGQKTFTSNDSLRFAHLLRKKADAILTGSGTILADHPLFTIRHVEDHLGKRRFLAILDRRGRVPADYLAEARGRGLDPLIYKDVQAALADLADKGARDVLVEAGPALSQAILDSHPWAMSVIIPHHNNDKIEVEFNTQESMPFAPEAFRWDFFLPC